MTIELSSLLIEIMCSVVGLNAMYRCYYGRSMNVIKNKYCSEPIIKE